MLQNASLRTKLLGITAVCLLPLAGVLAVVFQVSGQASSAAEQECRALGVSGLDHTLQGITALCATQQENLDLMVDSALRVGRHLMQKGGGLRAAPGTSVTWKAVNMFTRAESTVTLPQFQLGGEWLGQNRDFKKPSPLVDEVMQLTDQTCTIFQRMNEAGDMIRVATSVRDKDGSRAVGTFIPRINPDGTPNAVIASVLKGQTYRGRAFVVTSWYVTAYEPIFDADGKVMGILYVGVQQERVPALRKAVANLRVGQTGYAFVLDSKGQVIVSRKGAQDGTNILDAKDAEGKPVMEELCKKAAGLDAGAIGEQVCLWQEPGEERPRRTITRFTYFKTWDWVIGARIAEEEVLQAGQRVAEIGRHGQWLLGAVAGIAALLAVGLSLWVAKGILTPLGRVVGVLQAVATGDFSKRLHLGTRNELGQMASALNQAVEGVSEAMRETRGVAEAVATASRQLATASEGMSGGAQEQAASLEEVASSLEEITATVTQNAESARQARQLAEASREVAQKGGSVVTSTITAMAEINQSSRKIADIITAIDEIAFQTNLLALNAAVEAARAGEQGRGFAVVAAEVRSLAQRSAGAAKEIKGLIQDSVAKVAAGSELATKSGQSLQEIVSSVQRVTDIVAEIATASREQTLGIEQVNKAVTQTDAVTQANAAQTEEVSGTAQALASQAGQLQTLVARFRLEEAESQGKPAPAVSPSARRSLRTARGPAPAQPVRQAAEKAEAATPPPAEESGTRPEPILAGTGHTGGDDGFQEF
jgi:methyl-accepting chemotaxis protein